MQSQFASAGPRDLLINAGNLMYPGAKDDVNAFNCWNNLPSGLISGAAVKAAGEMGLLRNAVLIGVDLGPNLSVTGSLATILWLIAIRREGQEVGFWKFLKWGSLVMPPALALAILAVLLSPQR